MAAGKRNHTPSDAYYLLLVSACYNRHRQRCRDKRQVLPRQASGAALAFIGRRQSESESEEEEESEEVDFFDAAKEA